MPDREQSYRLTLQLLKAVKRRLREVLGPDDKELQVYYGDYKAELGRVRTAPSSREEFADASCKSQVTLVGDFHTLEHAQKTFLRLLEDAGSRKVRPILALEMASARYDVPLSQYLKGRIGENDFLEKIRYFEEWGFDFTHYRAILDHARGLKLAVHGLNSEGSLDARDVFMGHRLRHLVNQYPGQPVFVLVGDMHLASGHLPRRLESQGISPVVLFQNSDIVYLKKLKAKKAPVGWWRVGKGKFLHNNTAPQVKLQTYLTWMEHGGEALCQMYGYAGQSECEGEIELTDSVQRLAKVLMDLLGIHGDPPSDFQVYEGDSLSFLQDEYFKTGPGKRYALLVKDARSLFVLKGRILYVPRLDLNRTVEETTHLLMDVWLPTGKDLEAFLGRIHYFAGGFLGSKIVNQTRPAPTAADMNGYLARYAAVPPGKDRTKMSREAGVYEAALRLIEFLVKDQQVARGDIAEVLASDWDFLYDVSRCIGYNFANRLYALYDEGHLAATDLKRYAFEQNSPFYLLGARLRVA